MICPKCGHENDVDATFCESCGSNLNQITKKTVKKEDMTKSTKILIVICIVLVAGLGIIAGAFIQMNKQLAPNTISIANSTVNNTVNQTQSVQNTTQKTSSQSISASQAASIALKYGKKFSPQGQWSVGSVDFVPAANYENTANYMVELSNNGPVTPGVARAMDVRINAQTGAIMQ